MADTKFTLLELHLGDGAVRIGSRTPGEGSTDVNAESGSDTDDDDGGTCPARTAAKLLLAVGGLVALLLVASKLLGDDEDIEELEELADLDAGDA
jgi:hypothetical protein